MDSAQLEQVRRFNRLVTQRVGALDDSYLRRGRPLGEARLIFEIGADGVDVRTLRERLGLDSGYLSRLLRSLEAQDLVETLRRAEDGRRRRVVLTRKGRSERSTYDRLSDRLAASMLAPLDPERRKRLAAAMAEVERLLRAAAVEVAVESPRGGDARRCLAAYFRELGERFDTGYDPAEEPSGAIEDCVPPSGAFVVARLDGAPVGCGALKQIDEATGEIKRVWTAPSARGLGVARKMLRALEGLAREAGLEMLRLDTNKALVEARALYRAEGYREVPRFNDNPYAHHWFAKEV
jgi:DNA-binding MarR family transcriptional regulator/GNAT superfamily N-acetyltransferase